MNGLAGQLIINASSQEPEDTGSVETVGKLSQKILVEPHFVVTWRSVCVCVSETLELRSRVLTHAIKSLKSEPRNLPF